MTRTANKDFFENEVRETNNDNFLRSFLDTIDHHKRGYFMECDLEYLQTVHKKTKHFPFCPEDKTNKIR